MRTRKLLAYVACALAVVVASCDGGGGGGGNDPVVDLIVAILTAPASGGAGATISVPTTIENTGGATAPSFRVGIYLSADDTINPASDTLIGTWDVTTLAGTATSQSDVSATIPGTTAPG